jgi:dienelactone hydrolase
LKGFDSFAQRNAELRLVRDELLKIHWIDKTRLYLMGHSEGGMTVSRTGVGGFRAVIASGFWCHKRLEIKHGSAPFLILNWEDDPWYRGRHENRNPSTCQDHVDARPNSKQVIIPGQGHATSDSFHAKEAVVQFLSSARLR